MCQKIKSIKTKVRFVKALSCYFNKLPSLYKQLRHKFTYFVYFRWSKQNSNLEQNNFLIMETIRQLIIWNKLKSQKMTHSTVYMY